MTRILKGKKRVSMIHMANQEHLKILKQGMPIWNKWRRNNPTELPDLEDADLRKFKLSRINFCKANLAYANLSKVNLRFANFNEANLEGVELEGAILWKAKFIGANLNGANIKKADLQGANLSNATLQHTWLSDSNLSGAILRKADLTHTILDRAILMESDLSEAYLQSTSLFCTRLIDTNLEGAILCSCDVYGVSAWDIKVNEKTKQISLKITFPDDESADYPITVDNLEIAQFIYLLISNEKIRQVIDIITSKVVLILGRFTPERQAVLEAIQEELSRHDYIPIIFNFKKPATRDITETISTLAHLARFIIADITDPRSIPQELEHIIPTLPSVLCNLHYKGNRSILI